MDELCSLLDESGATLKLYHAKFYDFDGNWCTFGGRDTNEARMIQIANEMAANNGITHSSFEGITSAVILCNVTEKNITTLQAAPDVYLVDASAFLWESSPNYDPSVDIVVPGYEWQLDALLNKRT